MQRQLLYKLNLRHSRIRMAIATLYTGSHGIDLSILSTDNDRTLLSSKLVKLLNNLMCTIVPFNGVVQGNTY